MQQEVFANTPMHNNLHTNKIFCIYFVSFGRALTTTTLLYKEVKGDEWVVSVCKQLLLKSLTILPDAVVPVGVS